MPAKPEIPRMRYLINFASYEGNPPIYPTEESCVGREIPDDFPATRAYVFRMLELGRPPGEKPPANTGVLPG